MMQLEVMEFIQRSNDGDIVPVCLDLEHGFTERLTVYGASQSATFCP